MQTMGFSHATPIWPSEHLYIPCFCYFFVFVFFVFCWCCLYLFVASAFVVYSWPCCDLLLFFVGSIHLLWILIRILLHRAILLRVHLNQATINDTDHRHSLFYIFWWDLWMSHLTYHQTKRKKNVSQTPFHFDRYKDQFQWFIRRWYITNAAFIPNNEYQHYNCNCNYDLKWRYKTKSRVDINKHVLLDSLLHVVRVGANEPITMLLIFKTNMAKEVLWTKLKTSLKANVTNTAAASYACYTHTHTHNHELHSLQATAQTPELFWIH